MGSETITDNIDPTKVAKVASDALTKGVKDFVSDQVGSVTGTLDSIKDSLATAEDLTKSVSKDPSQTEGWWSWIKSRFSKVYDFFMNIVNKILEAFGIAPAAPDPTPAPAPPAAPAAGSEPPAPAPDPTVEPPAPTPEKPAPAKNAQGKAVGGR